MLIAVVHWNSPAETLACLRSLLGAADAGHDILVVDNSSARDDDATFQSMHARVRCLRLPENRGYAAALNHARARCLDGQYLGLFMLNADCILEAETIDALLQAQSDRPGSILGCLIMDVAGNRIAMPEKFLHANGRWRSGPKDRPVAMDHKAPPSRVTAVHGAAWFVPTELLRGQDLDEQFFLYCEETDYCLHAARSGAATYLVPGARVRHVGSAQGRSSEALQHMLDYYRTRNEIELWRRHAGRWWYWIAARKGVKSLLALLLVRPGARYMALGWLDALQGRMGKRFAPESVWTEP